MRDRWLRRIDIVKERLLFRREGDDRGALDHGNDRILFDALGHV